MVLLSSVGALRFHSFEGSTPVGSPRRLLGLEGQFTAPAVQAIFGLFPSPRRTRDGGRIYPALLAQLVKLSIVPRTHVERVGSEKFNLEPMGSGPYRFVSWQKGMGSTVSEGKTSRSCATQPSPSRARRWGTTEVMSAPRHAIVPRRTSV